MGQFSTFDSREIEKFLLHIGCEFKRQKGSHRIFKKEGINSVITIPERRNVSIGVVLKTLKDLGISKEEFLKVIKEL